MDAKHILVIEDDPDVRDSLREGLELAGVRVLLARDGAEGLSHLQEGPRPAAILLDLRMPRLGGEGFLRALRADARFDHVPVVTMTAGREEPRGRGVAAHLRKPFDLDALLRVVVCLCEAAAA